MLRCEAPNAYGCLVNGDFIVGVAAEIAFFGGDCAAVWCDGNLCAPAQ
jgi:hypothetical protein